MIEIILKIGQSFIICFGGTVVKVPQIECVIINDCINSEKDETLSIIFVSNNCMHVYWYTNTQVM